MLVCAAGMSFSLLRASGFILSPTSYLQAAMAQAVQVVQFSIIGVVVLGDKLFPMLGMQIPAIYEQVKDKKFAVGKPFWLSRCTQNHMHTSSTVASILQWDQTL